MMLFLDVRVAAYALEQHSVLLEQGCKLAQLALCSLSSFVETLENVDELQCFRFGNRYH
jgi:hypothetical protein